MTWAVTERELPGWNERPYFSCFPGTSTQWQPEEQYDYARERYYTETLPPGAWACGVWAATYRDTRRLAGVEEGYDGTAAERDRIGDEFDTTLNTAIETSNDPAEREYLERIRRESTGPDDPGRRCPDRRSPVSNSGCSHRWASRRITSLPTPSRCSDGWLWRS